MVDLVRRGRIFTRESSPVCVFVWSHDVMDLVVEKNLVYNAMKEMRDGAGIYLSFCHHVSVSGNFVRDVEMDPINKANRKKGEYAHTQAHA